MKSVFPDFCFFEMMPNQVYVRTVGNSKYRYFQISQRCCEKQAKASANLMKNEKLRMVKEQKIFWLIVSMSRFGMFAKSRKTFKTILRVR